MKKENLQLLVSVSEIVRNLLLAVSISLGLILTSVSIIDLFKAKENVTNAKVTEINKRIDFFEELSLHYSERLKKLDKSIDELDEELRKQIYENTMEADLIDKVKQNKIDERTAIMETLWPNLIKIKSEQ